MTRFADPLENPENWDREKAETREPVKSPRVIVSVAFRRDDFATVEAFSERTGKKISEFIREAALEKAAGRAAETTIHVYGSTGSLWATADLPNTTRVDTLQIEDISTESVATAA